MHKEKSVKIPACREAGVASVRNL